ncbi:MAG: 2'-5' RNA ligase family protein, partial [Nocardioidaceae bacterium]
MRLFAAVLPPASAASELADLVASVPAKGHQLDEVPPDEMHLPITSFGNVALNDSRSLARALQADVATWAPVSLRFAGGAALEWRGDESVWAKLDGDVDGLKIIGHGVPRSVQRLGFFVDRRQFRPWLAVGTITDHTTAPYLQSLVDGLNALEGQTWTLTEVV